MRQNNKIKQGDIKSEDLSLTTEQLRIYEVELITPMYGGGVVAGETDEHLPFRASEIRGQLRYWWRFLVQNHPDDSIRISDARLFKAEQALWGGLNANCIQQPAVASKIKVIVSNVRKGTRTNCCTYEEKTNGAGRVLRDNHNNPRYHMPSFLPEMEGEKESLGYCLFPAQGKDPNRRPSTNDYPAVLYAPPASFRLTLQAIESLDEDDWMLIQEAVRWWGCLGGIGARTRRGVGSVNIRGVVNLTKEEASSFKCDLRVQANTYEYAISAWNQAIGKYKHFRQGVGLGRKSGNRNTPGRSFWPEPDSIREVAGIRAGSHRPEHVARVSFPRAAFGMPIIFEFKGAGEPTTSTLNQKGTNRMASPLILKAIKDGEEYRAVAMLLPTDSPTELELSNYDNSELNLEDRPIDIDEAQWASSIDWKKQWWRTSLAEKVEPVRKYTGHDALSAFLNFFAKD